MTSISTRPQYKPLFELKFFNFNQIGRSWCQSIGNWGQETRISHPFKSISYQNVKFKCWNCLFSNNKSLLIFLIMEDIFLVHVIMVYLSNSNFVCSLSQSLCSATCRCFRYFSVSWFLPNSPNTKWSLNLEEKFLSAAIPKW